MTTLQALILGIVEGATEFLPVSSTGHLILASGLLRLEQTEFLKTFEIAVQLGAIAAVLAAYPRRLLTDLSVMKRVLVETTGVLAHRLLPRRLHHLPKYITRDRNAVQNRRGGSNHASASNG